MTAYAPTWTGRLKIKYFAAGAIHSQVWRYPGPSSGSGVTDLITVITAYYEALQPLLWDDFQVSAVTVADIDSPVFLPITNPFGTLVGDIVSADALTPEDKADALSFVGRTTGGNPWRISQFGTNADVIETGTGKNFRILESENADIAAAIVVLQAGAGTILGNDGNTIAVYDYANWKPYDHWVKNARTGT